MGLIIEGYRTEEGVRVRKIEDGSITEMPAHREIVNHSPDGFEWGYNGSGPSQLAMAIVVEMLKYLYNWDNVIIRRVIQPLSLAFRSEVVSRFPTQAFKFTDDDMKEWFNNGRYLFRHYS